MRHGACLHNWIIYSQQSESIVRKLLINEQSIGSVYLCEGRT